MQLPLFEKICPWLSRWFFYSVGPNILQRTQCLLIQLVVWYCILLCKFFSCLFSFLNCFDVLIRFVKACVYQYFKFIIVNSLFLYIFSYLVFQLQSVLGELHSSIIQPPRGCDRKLKAMVNFLLFLLQRYRKYGLVLS